MLLNIITDTIAAHSDLDIVSKRDRATGLLEAAENTNADVVVVARSGAAIETAFDELLYRHPRLKVIEILDEGRYGTLHELQSRHRSLGEMSPPQLVEAIRAAGAGATRADP
jgi:DNA-binding NarL/FixJ family response regulator